MVVYLILCLPYHPDEGKQCCDEHFLVHPLYFAEFLGPYFRFIDCNGNVLDAGADMMTLVNRYT